METLGERLKRIRELRGVSRVDLAKRSGVGYSTLAEIENGGMKSTTKIRQIAEALNVQVKYLETGTGEMDAPAVVVADSDYVDVLGYAQAVGLSDGAEALEYQETHSLKFKASSLRRQGLFPKDLGITYGKGDSMHPDIRDGDAIMFDTSKTRPIDDEWYLIVMYGVTGATYSVKECAVLDDEVYFQSINTAGDHNWKRPRRMNNEDNPITIVGRVVWTAGWR